MDAPIGLGDRIAVDDHKGSVLFAGAVEGMRGEWIGLDWDEAERGKHDGSFKGRRYFQAKSATSGSFLRPEKADRGIPLMAAIRARYGGHDPTLESFSGHKVGGMAQKEIQFVGVELIEGKQRDPRRLRAAVVDGLLVSSAGPGLGELVSLRELDLSINLFSDWAQLGACLAALPRLAVLNISRNRMKPWPAQRLEGGTKIIDFVANECGLDSTHWAGLVEALPKVENLGLAQNSIACLALPTPTALASLRSLDISFNHLSGWSEVMSLSGLPSLHTLNLMMTGLTEVVLPLDGSAFPALDMLYLNANKIKEWSSVNALSRLAKLRYVVLDANPVMELEIRSTSRQIVLAEVPQISVLDREDIEPQERRGAEIDYLKRYGKAFLAAQDDAGAAADFERRHPRYARLVEVYGAPEAAELAVETAKHNSGLISAHLLRLTLRHGGQELQRALPSSMMVEKLRPLVCRLFRIPRDRPLLMSVVNGNRPNVEMELDNELRELAFYNIEDDDILIIK